MPAPARSSRALRSDLVVMVMFAIGSVKVRPAASGASEWFRSAGPADRVRFDAEVGLLAQLNHPNLVQVLDAGEHEADAFLVLERVDGPTLSELLAHGALGRERTERLGRELADALAYVHANGVIHRDVKPSNVLFDGAGRSRLADFGIARVMDATTRTLAGATMGTAAYMAPEQVEGARVTPAADVYALGLVLLECLTGERAFAGPDREAALARLARSPTVPSDLDPEWRELITAMTAREPDARPPAGEIHDRLAVSPGNATPSTATGDPTQPVTVVGAAAAGGPPLTPTRTWRPTPDDRPPPGRARRARGAVLAAIAVVALAVLGAALLAAGGGGDSITTRTTTTTTPPTTTIPVTTTVPVTSAPALDCSALQNQRKALDTQQRDISKTYKKDPATRERLLQQLEDQKRSLDTQLKACKP